MEEVSLRRPTRAMTVNACAAQRNQERTRAIAVIHYQTRCREAACSGFELSHRWRMLKGSWDVDAYKVFGSGFLIANVAIGVAVIPVAIWVSKKFGERMGSSPKMQWLMRELAGYNLNAAGRLPQDTLRI